MAKRNFLHRANNKRKNSGTSGRKNTVGENTDKWNRLFFSKSTFYHTVSGGHKGSSNDIWGLKQKLWHFSNDSKCM